jgi:3-oxoacyl-[acyl-carrier-protein] synthase I
LLGNCLKTRRFLVCGVDSYINASSLLWLDQHQRLKTDENSDGVIPGEGAAAVLVTKRPSPNTSMAVNISGLGFAKETATVFNEEPLLGFGLAEATKGALREAGLQLHEADFRISDVTGESYGFREQALSLSRVMRSRKEEFPIWHSSDSTGDIGAASGMSQLVIYWHSARKDYSPGKKAVCYTSAVQGVRAVAITNASVPPM